MTDDHPESRQEQLTGFQRRGRELLHEQTRALDELIHELNLRGAGGNTESIRVTLLMLQAVGVSVHSVFVLTRERDMSIRDCFGIARSAVETAINAAYISVEGKPVAEQAIRHMRQKRWRDLHREATIGNQRITVSRDIGLDLQDVPGLRDAVDEYTNKRGGEVRDWTSQNLESRISAISTNHSRAGLCLGVAVFAIYRPSSELLHGSYYGVNLFWQGSQDSPARTRSSFDELWVTEHFITLLTALFFGVSGAVDAIASVHKLKGHSERQDKLSQDLSTLIDEMSGDDQSSEHSFQPE